ncbi:MAG: response regulator transcription factor [Bacteroidia bacterium]
MDKIRILVVEDDIFISQDIQECLEAMDYHVSGVAYDSIEAEKALEASLPDLVLLDVHLGDGKDGISIGEQLRDRYQVPFIYLTSFANKSVLERAKQTKPMGYIVKPFNEKDLFSSIEIALFNHAQRWQSANWNQEFVNKRLDTDFTPKEVEVIQDMFEGKTNRQLADKHFISLNTVKTHVKRIYDKLNVHSRSEAMAVLRQGLAG